MMRTMTKLNKPYSEWKYYEIKQDLGLTDETAKFSVVSMNDLKRYVLLERGLTYEQVELLRSDEYMCSKGWGTMWNRKPEGFKQITWYVKAPDEDEAMKFVKKEFGKLPSKYFDRFTSPIEVPYDEMKQKGLYRESSEGENLILQCHCGDLKKLLPQIRHAQRLHLFLK